MGGWEGLGGGGWGWRDWWGLAAGRGMGGSVGLGGSRLCGTSFSCCLTRIARFLIGMIVSLRKI
jgi:hypothetical protein